MVNTAASPILKVRFIHVPRETLRGPRQYLIHHSGDEFVPDVIANRDDECIDGVKKSKAQCQQTHLLPAQHPAVQPVRKTPATGRGEFKALLKVDAHFTRKTQKLVNVFVLV